MNNHAKITAILARSKVVIKARTYAANIAPALFPADIWNKIIEDIPLAESGNLSGTHRFFRNRIHQKAKQYLLKHYAPTEEIKTLILTQLKQPLQVYNIIRRLNTPCYQKWMHDVSSHISETWNHYHNPLLWYCMDDNAAAFAKLDKHIGYNYDMDR